MHSEHLYHQGGKPKDPSLSSYPILYLYSLGIQASKTNTQESGWTTPSHPQGQARSVPLGHFITQICPSATCSSATRGAFPDSAAAACWPAGLSPASRGTTHRAGILCGWYSHDHALPCQSAWMAPSTSAYKIQTSQPESRLIHWGCG